MHDRGQVARVACLTSKPARLIAKPIATHTRYTSLRSRRLKSSCSQHAVYTRRIERPSQRLRQPCRGDTVLAGTGLDVALRMDQNTRDANRTGIIVVLIQQRAYCGVLQYWRRLDACGGPLIVLIYCLASACIQCT